MKRKVSTAQLSIALILLIATTSVLADTNNIFGSWSGITLKGDFGSFSPKGKDFHWVIIDQVRTRNDRDLNPGRYPGDNGFSPRFSENLVWVQGGYSLTPYSSLWIGYTHDWHKPLSGAHFQESRPYQDYLWNQNFGDFGVTARTRLEERNAITNQLDDGNFGIRIRQLLKVKHPVPGVKNLSMYVGDEVLAHLNKSRFGPEGFSGNRALGGLAYQVTKNMDLTLGYLGQYLKNPGGDDLFTHNILFDMAYTF